MSGARPRTPIVRAPAISSNGFVPWEKGNDFV